jgi:group II intron reverse transcriptase/maturase
MRSAENVLGVIRERGRQGLPLEDIYRQLYNPNLYLLAYENLRNNKGALTAGVVPKDTLDGMSMKRIQRVIDALRAEEYRWKPARRVYIPKKSGKLRPLGMPTGGDKLLQEVMRLILEAYYEPQFSNRSHAYRPGRGCHTALANVHGVWTGTTWFIEGDISQCFDRLDHGVLMTMLGEKLHDNRFLRLVATMLKAGYLEEWRWNATYSGTPQGGVISPILSNIYLDRLDTYVEQILIPQNTRGEKRRDNPEYTHIGHELWKAKRAGDTQRIKELRQRQRLIPCRQPDDPNYRRLRYVRYADDFLLGYVGPKKEADEIKEQLGQFLQETLKLELSEEKTFITHARTQHARFLGYEVGVQQVNDKIVGPKRARCVNGVVELRVPTDVISGKCVKYMKDGKPTHRPYLLNDSIYAIMTQYQAEYRGVVQYYAYARNVGALSRLHNVMKESLLKTLSAKLKCHVTEVKRRYKAKTDVEGREYACLQVTVERENKPPLVARFGGIPLRRQTVTPKTVIHDLMVFAWNKRTDILDRLLADQCEVCGHKGDCEVHHVRKMSNLHKLGQREKPEWVKRMIAMRRKTLVVCQPCHLAIHAGKRASRERSKVTGEPDALKGARPVRGRGDGKGAA